MPDPVLFAFRVRYAGPDEHHAHDIGTTLGIRRSLSLLLAEICGFTIQLSSKAAAIGPALSSIADARAVLGVVVGLYLCVLASRLWHRSIAMGTRPVLWHQVFVTTLLNPKVLVFSLVIIPMSTPESGRYLIAFATIVPAIGSLWIILGAMAGGLVPDHRFRVIPKIGAVVLACFAFALIISSIHDLMNYPGLRATYSENIPKITL